MTPAVAWALGAVGFFGGLGLLAAIGYATWRDLR